MKLNHIFITLFLLVKGLSFGQVKIDYEPSVDVLVRAENLQKEGKFEEAAAEYDKVYEGDSLFFRYALHMKMANLIQMEEYEKVREIGDKYWYFRHDLPTEFYLSYGTALDKLEAFDEAHSMYRSILEEFPLNHSIRYNYGVSLSLAGKKQEAYEAFKETVEINPFYDRVHLALAGLAVNEKQTTKALMALGMYLWLSVEKRSNYNQIRYANYLGSSKYWTDKDFAGSAGIDLGGNSSYAAIDELVHNYVALRDKYKTPSKLDYEFVNQSHLIFSQLKDMKVDENDFWSDTYVAFYKELMKDKQFAPYTYIISNYIDDDKIMKTVVKNKKDALAFLTWGKNTLNELHAEVDLEFVELGKTKVERNSSNRLIEIIGDYEYDKSNSKIVGQIQIYAVNGRKTAEGTYNSNGNKDGEWKYYHPNGYIKEREVFDDGVSIDTSYIYFENGLKKVMVTYKDGKVHGDVGLYHNGILYRTLPYTNGEMKDGVLKDFHPIGSLSLSYNLKEGKADGPFKSLYDSGEIYREGTYKNGDVHGKRVTYYKNGKVSVEEYFVEGKNDGDYISYYEDGQIEAKGKIKEDNKIGEWLFYYENGNKSKVQNFDESGKENGIEEVYTKSGWKLSEHSFKKGVVDSYKFFNEKGEVISEGLRKAGELAYKSYFLNGNINSEGTYSKKGREGEWKFYDFNGTLLKKIDYKDDVPTGEYIEYYVNGAEEIKYKYDENGDSKGYYENYYKNGNLYRQGFLKEGNMDGPWRDYYRNGDLYKSYFYSDNNTEGFISYYTIDNKLSSASYYQNDLEKFIIYYDTAGVALDTVYQIPGERKVELKRCATCPVFMTVDVLNNQYHGEQVFTYPNGQLEAKGQVFNGKKTGLWKTYHPNGQLASEGRYEDSDREGEWKFYNFFGELSSKTNYKNGKEHGIHESYDENGNIDFKANYAWGDLNGEVFYYVGDESDHKRDYSYGYILSYSYKKNGKTITSDMKNETAQVKIYWDNGQVAREFEIKNGWFEGPYKKYYKNGQLAYEQTYKNDDRNSALKEYYKNGKLKKEANYVDDLAEGDYILYYPSGNKKVHYVYLHNKLHGWTTYYKADGTVAMRVLFMNDNVISVE
ncbi:MAG: hypothetical protein R3277_05280 [Brumimicrobium sp.]|nr:hypothetical protein [Brumimicrobium sp.]